MLCGEYEVSIYMREKPNRFQFRTDELFNRRLAKAAEVLDRPASLIAREAIDEKLKALAATDRRLKRALEEVAA